MKMHKNCCHQSCSFWLRYAPNRLSAGGFDPDPTGELTTPLYPQLVWGVGPPGKGKEWGDGKRRDGGKRGREGKGGDGVPECPHPELASLLKDSVSVRSPHSDTRKVIVIAEFCLSEGHVVGGIWCEKNEGGKFYPKLKLRLQLKRPRGKHTDIPLTYIFWALFSPLMLECEPLEWKSEGHPIDSLSFFCNYLYCAMCIMCH